MADYYNGDPSEEIVYPDYFNGDLVEGIVGDYFNGDLVGGASPVPVPENVAVAVTAFFDLATDLYTVRTSWTALEESVDSYQWRSFDPRRGGSISAWRAEHSGSSRDVFRDAWIEVRSVKEGRYSQPVRVAFSEFTYPAVNTPRDLTVEVTEDTSSVFGLTLDWLPPANLFGRTVRYYVDRGGISFDYHTAPANLRFSGARSNFPYFAVRAEASDGSVSGYIRVNDADYVEPETGNILVLNNKILVIGDKILHIA